MNVNNLTITLALTLFAMNFAGAQSFIDEMVKEWERAKAYTEEYLHAMPDSSYALKPSPEMRSFAEQMLHLTDANYRFAAATSGVPSPVAVGESERTPDKSKANVTKLVLKGYDYVISNIKRLTPQQLAEKIDFFNQHITREMVLMKLFEHQTHHRGQATVYLRLAKVTPPKEKLF